MPANYTGVGSHVSQSTSPVISAPADGDPDNAATFATAFQWLTDHVAKIWAGLFTGTGAGPGLQGVGGPTNGAGVVGQGTGTGDGGSFTCGASGTPGVGVRGTGVGSSAGVQGNGGSSGGPGVVGVGSSAGAGGQFTAGATGPAVATGGATAVGARGAINLNNQSAIGNTGLQPGDLFWDGTNLRFCKVAGASVIVI